MADTFCWTHNKLPTERKMQMTHLMDKEIRLNKSAINCYIKEAEYIWLTFNDCNTGRGYLLKLPFNKKESINKISSALNAFDKKFVMPKNVRAYADYTTLYVVDISTNKKEELSFKETLNIDFNNIHQTIDSINITPNRIFVQLIKNGQKLPMEKNISL